MPHITPKTAALLAALAALTLSAAARADDDRRARQPGGPQPVIEVLKAGGGTVSGTIGSLAANRFVLNDGRDEIDVASRAPLPEGLNAGDPITVVGKFDDGVLRPRQIIRQDGTAFGRVEADHDDD
ncbi:hypothetical protein J2847_002749 [Azospirillum agricola]|uniref:hypothetical protein n=1 Tax=Azospirillum agricola TaxID=1720247 RepID=UPI001AE9CC78|nr:hypothetical protein [Azospirillum agricola]MBP2229450.1 hypothetical protein [Azospirillum agricola]